MSSTSNNCNILPWRLSVHTYHSFPSERWLRLLSTGSAVLGVELLFLSPFILFLRSSSTEQLGRWWVGVSYAASSFRVRRYIITPINITVTSAAPHIPPIKGRFLFKSKGLQNINKSRDETAGNNNLSILRSTNHMLRLWKYLSQYNYFMKIKFITNPCVETSYSELGAGNGWSFSLSSLVITSLLIVVTIYFGFFVVLLILGFSVIVSGHLIGGGFTVVGLRNKSYSWLVHFSSLHVPLQQKRYNIIILFTHV